MRTVKPASNDGPAKSADVDASLSALLASVGKDANNEAMLSEDLLEGTRGGFNGKREDFSAPLRRSGGYF